MGFSAVIYDVVDWVRRGVGDGGIEDLGRFSV